MEKVCWDKYRDVSRWHVLLPRSKLLLKQTPLLLSCWVTTAIWDLLLVLLGRSVWYEFSRLLFSINICLRNTFNVPGIVLGAWGSKSKWNRDPCSPGACPLVEQPLRTWRPQIWRNYWGASQRWLIFHGYPTSAIYHVHPKVPACKCAGVTRFRTVTCPYYLLCEQSCF